MTQCQIQRRRKDQNIIFIDLDIIFLRPMIKEVLRLMKKTKSTLSMAHECGCTGLHPYPAYNSGLIFMNVCDQNRKLTKNWLKESEENKYSSTKNWTDQFSLVGALNRYDGKILTLHKTYNLRIHPVFGSNEYVWGSVNAIHNHQFTKGYYYEFQLEQTKQADEYQEIHLLIERKNKWREH